MVGFFSFFVFVVKICMNSVRQTLFPRKFAYSDLLPMGLDANDKGGGRNYLAKVRVRPITAHSLPYSTSFSRSIDNE